MVASKKIIRNDDPRIGDKNLIPKFAAIIEQTLDAFGITARVSEVNNRPNDIEFCMETALGTPLENITKLHKDIAMALASMTGDVEIEAPIPRRSLVAVRLPYNKEWFEQQLKSMEAFKFLPKTEVKAESSGTTWRQFIAGFFYLLANLLGKIGNLINKI